MNKSLKGDWYVYHRDLAGYQGTSCSLLSRCLAYLRAWHDSHPKHEVVTVFLELKDDWDGTHSSLDLDKALQSHLPGAVFGVGDLVRSCKGAKTAREATKKCGWPTLSSMRGKLFFVLHGDDAGRLNRYAGDSTRNPADAAKHAAFIAPAISSSSKISSFPNAVFFNLNSDDFVVGRAVFAAGYVSRVYYYNTSSRQGGINDKNNWNIAVNNSIHNIATDEVDPSKAPWTITHNARGWPFRCMLQDCSGMAEDTSGQATSHRAPPSREPPKSVQAPATPEKRRRRVSERHLPLRRSL